MDAQAILETYASRIGALRRALRECYRPAIVDVVDRALGWPLLLQAIGTGTGDLAWAAGNRQAVRDALGPAPGQGHCPPLADALRRVYEVELPSPDDDDAEPDGDEEPEPWRQ